jgi:hypothetical protein
LCDQAALYLLYLSFKHCFATVVHNKDRVVVWQLSIALTSR